MPKKGGGRYARKWPPFFKAIDLRLFNEKTAGSRQSDQIPLSGANGLYGRI